MLSIKRVAGRNICKQMAGVRCLFTDVHLLLAKVQCSYASMWKLGTCTGPWGEIQEIQIQRGAPPHT